MSPARSTAPDPDRAPGVRGLLAGLRARPLHALELALALALLALALANEALRSILRTTLEAAYLAILSVITLLPADPSGVLATALASALIPLALYAPVVRAALHAPPHRRAWLGPYFVVGIFVLPMTFAALSSPLWWALELAAALLGWHLAARPRWRLLALLPTLLVLRPVLSHSPLGDRYWTPARLAARCDGNAGARAAGLDPTKFATRHYAITPVRDGLALFTSERASAWLRLDDRGRATLDAPISLRGNIWEGCVDDGTVWLTKRGQILRVDVPDDLTRAAVTTLELPDPPDIPRELDFADVVCGLADHRLLVTEVVQGGVREVDPATGAQHRIALGGANIQALRRGDGKIVGIDTARLFVLDPATHTLIWRGAAGVCVMGLDLCRADGRVALTDMAGRLRIFTRDGDGYTLTDSLALRAPRRVAFSPDCTHLAVTSADDTTVSVLTTAPLELRAEHSLGPGLRDLAFVAPRTVAVADACMVTTLDAW